MEKNIVQATQILKQGGIVIFPTDTTFVIGCRVDVEKAVERLFKIRKRPKTQPTSVLVDTVLMAQKYLKPISKEVVDKLIEPYWPGALTIVLPALIEKVPTLVRGGSNTLGVRIPNHQVIRAVIRKVGVGILGPSANFHREPTPYNLEDVNPKLLHLVDYILPGECSIKEASTVIDCSEEPWRAIREGPIKIKDIN